MHRHCFLSPNLLLFRCHLFIDLSSVSSSIRCDLTISSHVCQ
ncbi:hypothetical protein GLYMA_08G276202v4 [Glycine max]|nr:hypothetical protein GLYMA_08G276202v4 [Glycine max]KAH1053386.1 hypothetical protein GYH30_022601 [Glycine max]